MRLIDADALIHTHESEVAAIGKDWTVDDLATAIEVAPTIDAIPLSWIIAWCFKRYMETEVEVSVPTMIEAWWKEQEAQK